MSGCEQVGVSECEQVQEQASWLGRSPTHLLLVHILPHDAGEESVLHDLLGVLRAPTKPEGETEAKVTGRACRAQGSG